jgi:spore coat polysaccharide biosynthesis protein SpsF
VNITAIVQARMESSRLPGKVLMDICGSTMLELVVRRTQQSKLIDKVIVATTTSIADNVIIAECGRLNVPFFRGDEQDVLKRYYRTALAYGMDAVVRITSDCPLVDPRLTDKVIEAHLNSSADYTCNGVEWGFPRGLDTEIFNFKTLQKAYYEAQKDYEREHVTPYIYLHSDIFKLKSVQATGKLMRPDLRFTVDTEEDLKLMKEIYKRFYADGQVFYSEDVIDLLDRHPELVAINAHVVQKEPGK